MIMAFLVLGGLFLLSFGGDPAFRVHCCAWSQAFRGRAEPADRNDTQQPWLPVKLGVRREQPMPLLAQADSVSAV